MTTTGISHARLRERANLSNMRHDLAQLNSTDAFRDWGNGRKFRNIPISSAVLSEAQSSVARFSRKIPNLPNETAETDRPLSHNNSAKRLGATVIRACDVAPRLYASKRQRARRKNRLLFVVVALFMTFGAFAEIVIIVRGE